MPYRAKEYVPEVFQPDDHRISDLIYAQGAAESQRIRDNGLATALLWRGAGQAASGALSGLAQYKREEPMRREQERLRKEADKLRGLEQFAGAGGLSEEDRGSLLKREGFVEKGQDILDKDMSRKATKATYDDAAKKRADAEMSEITFALDQMRESNDPAAAYNAGIKGLKEKYKGKLDDLPDTHDQAALDKKVADIQKASDVLARNARAEHASKVLEDKLASHETHVKGAIGMMAPLVKSANTKPEWDRMWVNFDARTEGMTPEQKSRIEREIPYPREFSEQAWKEATDLEDKKDPSTPLGAAYQLWRERHPGESPKSAADEAEIQKSVARFTQASHVPSQYDLRQSEAEARRLHTFKQGINKQKNDKLLALNAAFSKEDITEEQLMQGKEDVQAWYLDQIGAPDGPSLSQIEAQSNLDLMGRPLSAQAQPGAARPQQQPITGRPQAGAGVLPQGMVMVRNPETGATGGLPLEQALEIEKRSGQSIIIGDRSGRGAGLPVRPPAATPAAPAAATAPAAPPPPSGTVMMQGPGGRLDRVAAKDVEQHLIDKWTIVPQREEPSVVWAKDLASRIYRDMTVGAPARPAATPRR